jgi:stage V sporulation protein SpoVS
MSNGFTLESDSNVTVYKRLMIAAGTAIMAGTVLDRVRNSATAEAQPCTAASTTSTIYAVAMETVSTTATSILCALITSVQTWGADPVNQATTVALAATYSGYNGQRMILGVQTLTPTIGGSGATAWKNLQYSDPTTGLSQVPSGTAFATVTTANNTGTDVPGTTGVFEQLGYTVISWTAGVPTTGRIVGRFLTEHAA